MFPIVIPKIEIVIESIKRYTVIKAKLTYDKIPVISKNIDIKGVSTNAKTPINIAIKDFLLVV